MSEREIQDAFEHGYAQLEAGLKRISSFVGIGVGVIDSLAIDVEGNPVVVEFKKIGGSAYDALIQAMDYAVWCRENFSWVEKTIRNAGHGDTIFRAIRIIIVAAEFDERIKRAARALEFDARLVSFAIHDYGGNTLIVPRVEVDTSVYRASEEPLPPKTKQQHFTNLSESIVHLYDKFEDAVRRLPDVDANYQPQGYIGIRYRGRNFVAVYPKREWLRLDAPLSAEEARIEGYVGYSSGDWGYFHLNDSTFDQGMELAKTAYNKVAGNETVR
jgi:hypothetical protein